METPTPWKSGRLDRLSGPSELLFGRTYEDWTVEASAFPPRGRVLCIASAGCTAIALAGGHEVTAVDINPVQLDYARARAAGAPPREGRAERLMGWGRRLLPLAGWSEAALREFLDLDDPAEQGSRWERRLDTRRFRWGLDALLSARWLGAFYADPFLRALPPDFGAVMRRRLERAFRRHSNRSNPYARALLLGEGETPAPGPGAARIRFARADAADYLESRPPSSFDGFSLSNILDGASPAYARRLKAAVRRAAAPGAVAVLRSFAEPSDGAEAARAAQDRSLLWGSVTMGPAEAL